jgi:hypothetical protein
LASSWSMASTRRLSADSSIEHTVEDYQVDGRCGRASADAVIHSYWMDACGFRLWITSRKNLMKFFFHTAGGLCLPS